MFFLCLWNINFRAQIGFFSPTVSPSKLCTNLCLHRLCCLASTKLPVCKLPDWNLQHSLGPLINTMNVILSTRSSVRIHSVFFKNSKDSKCFFFLEETFLDWVQILKEQLSRTKQTNLTAAVNFNLWFNHYTELTFIGRFWYFKVVFS